MNRILAVEDDPTQQFVLQVVLESYGLHADIVSTAEKALEILDTPESNYSLVLMDIRLPGMDGYECARAIRENTCEKISKIPILAVTAYAAIEDRRLCLDAGMDDYISKPYQMDVFEKLIRKHLEKQEFELLNASSFTTQTSMEQSNVPHRSVVNPGDATYAQN